MVKFKHVPNIMPQFVQPEESIRSTNCNLLLEEAAGGFRWELLFSYDDIKISCNLHNIRRASAQDNIYFSNLKRSVISSYGQSKALCTALVWKQHYVCRDQFSISSLHNLATFSSQYPILQGRNMKQMDLWERSF